MSNIDGFKQFADKLNKLSKDFQQEVTELTEYHLGEIELDAIRNAPDGGSLINTLDGPISQSKISPKRRGSSSISGAIGYEMKTKYSGSVFVERSAGDIAAYVEFSTGQDAARYLATVPAEWAAQARKFFVNGEGRIIGKPYLLPAFLKGKIEYVKDLKKALEKLKI